MLRDLINTYRQAFRLYVRQFTRPRTIEEAQEKQQFWAKTYALCGITSCILATYITCSQQINFNSRTDVPKEALLHDKSDTRPIKVYKVKNFSTAESYLYIPKQSNEQREPESESHEMDH